MPKRFDTPVGWMHETADGDYVEVGDYAELVMRVRNWLKESPMSERISARRCRELIAILDTGPSNPNE